MPGLLAAVGILVVGWLIAVILRAGTRRLLGMIDLNERIQKTTAEPVKTCPDCGGAVRRLLGAPALQFKGSGWYVTDYGKGSSVASAAKKERDEAKASESSTPAAPPKESKGTKTETAKASS